MSVEITREEVFPLRIDGRFLGKFTRDQIVEIRKATDTVLFGDQPILHALEIIAIVCRICNVEDFDMRSHRRSSHIAFSRQIAMAMVRAYSDGTLNGIGHLFGGRDHGTVMHAVQVVKDRRSLKDEGKLIRTVEAAIKASIAAQREQSVAARSNGSSPGDASGIALAGVVGSGSASSAPASGQRVVDA